MTDNISKAKQLLEYGNMKLNTVNIKAAFHTCIRKCHPDKGGNTDDVHKIMLARDLLLANISWETPHCAITNCKEAPLKNNLCNFHASYSK